VLIGSSEARVLTLTNDGAASARVTLSDLGGPDAQLFTRTISVPDEDGVFEVPAGASVEVTVTLRADAAGPIIGTLAVLACEDGCPHAIVLIGDAVLSGIECDEAIVFPTTNPGACSTAPATCQNVANAPDVIDDAVFEAGSDVELTLIGPTFPLSIDPGASATLDLSFCPQAVGDYRALLLVRTDDPRMIEISGHGGGSNITCAPSPVDFGLFGIGATIRRTVSCRNDGFEPGLISAANVTGAGFALAAPFSATTLDVGEQLSLELTVTSAVQGVLSGALEIASDDPDSPSISIALAAEAVDVGPCVATVTPASRDFGLVPVGDRRRSSIVFRNEGTSACLFGVAGLSTGTDPGLVLENPPAAGTIVDPGVSLPIALVFAPLAAGTSSGAIELSFTNPATAPIAVPIQGTGGEPSVAVTPSPLDFGTLPTGCAAPIERTLSIRRVTPGNGTITAIELVNGTSTAFALSAAPALPATIAFLSAVDVAVTFAPAAAAFHHAELRITVDGQAAPLVVPIFGDGSATSGRTDSFDLARGPLDVLFLVDDSASMGPAQTALAATIPDFTAALVASGTDFHLGVITTDMVDATKSGRLQGTPTVLDPTTAELATVLTARVQPGITGSGTERGIDAMRAAVTPPIAGNENAGFLRPDARLIVIYVSDEEDSSMNGIGETALADLRAAAGSGGFAIYPIVGPPAAPGCTGPQGFAGASPRWAELVARSPGSMRLAYCDAMSVSVGAITDALFGATAFALSGDPRPETIAVSVGGTAVPEISMTGERLWSYDRVGNQVIFTAAGAPPAGATVAIDYVGWCLSPTCGDGTADALESCDDGNADDTDACTAGCRLAICGDGLAQGGVEGCDDANSVDNDACRNSCVAAACGDGVLAPSLEDCDDGNAVSGDGCSASCIFEGAGELEPNNAFATGTLLSGSPPFLVRGSIPTVADVDFFRVDVPAGHHLDAYLTIESFDSCPTNPTGRLAFFDAGGVNQGGANLNGGPRGNCGRVWPYTVSQTRSLGAGRYGIRVNENGDNATIGTYYLRVDVIPDNTCGNRILESGERCDDGGAQSGDGCSTGCLLEPMQAIALPGAGVISGEIIPSYERNAVQLDVASTIYLRAESFVDAAFQSCPGIGTQLRLLSGDQVTELGSDGTDGVDNCSLISPVDPFARLGAGTYILLIEDNGNNSEIGGYELLLSSIPPDVCGNGVVELGLAEQCDDGNTTSGDGCSPACQTEP
jgi:cysteine-rich repeat protein